MRYSDRRLQILFSVLGLIAVAISIVLSFQAPNSFGMWASLIVALLFLWLSRRYHDPLL
jgi:uncharacterized membrane protein YccC